MYFHIKNNDFCVGLCFLKVYNMTPCVINNSRFEEITVVRNGGTHGNVSVSWVLTRNSSDPSPVTADLSPASGTLQFAQGQMLALIPLAIIDDELPEEAEAYLLTILPHTIQGGAEVSEPAQVGPLSRITRVNTSVTTKELRDLSLHIHRHAHFSMLSQQALLSLSPDKYFAI